MIKANLRMKISDKSFVRFEVAMTLFLSDKDKIQTV